ncbi:MAG TPA: hypothetical protein VFT74_06510 [Isosphaeraceae bacterium]|nr:hypothetical protein [Isosphaeraceae bacterium]
MFFHDCSFVYFTLGSAIMLEVCLDRYDGRLALSELRVERTVINGDTATITLPLSDEHEIEVYFPVLQGVISDPLLERAKSVLKSLASMDNQVQQACAEECARTGIASENFESYLSYISLGGAVVVLGYFGSAVNTNWDEQFTMRDGKWVRLSQA